MFELWLNNNVRTKIDESPNEQDIINAIADYLNDDPNAKLIVMYTQEHGKYIYAIVNGIKGYLEYLERYKEKLKNMTCMELKKDIIKIKDKKKTL